MYSVTGVTFPDPPATILCDMDGVLAQSTQYTLDRAAEDFGVSATEDEIREWDATVPGTNFDFGELVDQYYDENAEGYLLSMPPIDGAREALELFQEAGYTVKIVTHRPSRYDKYNKAWLDKHEFPYDEYVDDAPQVKVEVTGDVLIDDYHENVKDAIDAGVFGVLIKRPHSDESGLEDEAYVVASSISDVAEQYVQPHV